jgi:membrane protein YdbS with pleckstrin-like domain
LGIVEELRFRSNAERPDSLAIRTGWLRRRLIVVPIEQVDEILPREKRIILRGSA